MNENLSQIEFIRFSFSFSSLLLYQKYTGHTPFIINITKCYRWVNIYYTSMHHKHTFSIFYILYMGVYRQTHNFYCACCRYCICNNSRYLMMPYIEDVKNIKHHKHHFASVLGPFVKWISSSVRIWYDVLVSASPTSIFLTTFFYFFFFVALFRLPYDVLPRPPSLYFTRKKKRVRPITLTRGRETNVHLIWLLQASLCAKRKPLSTKGNLKNGK